MNIAIVDDERMELEAAENYLKNYIHENWSESEHEINIETYSCAKDFLKIFKPGMYGLIILDICMDEINGMQAAQIIRARGDTDVNIVFLTGNDDYLLNGYRVFAVGYFMKPVADNAEAIAKTLEYIFPRLCQKNPNVTLVVDGLEISVPNRNIFYADIDEHHRLCVHLADRKFVTTNSYSALWQVLSKDERFLECYHRIVINMDYIKSMEHDDFILFNGTRIPISQRKKKEVKAKFMHYFAHR